MRTTLEALLALDRPLPADGATGTNFFGMGLGPGEPPEMWNVGQPESELPSVEHIVATTGPLTNTVSSDADPIRDCAPRRRRRRG